MERMLGEEGSESRASWAVLVSRRSRPDPERAGEGRKRDRQAEPEPRRVMQRWVGANG